GATPTSETLTFADQTRTVAIEMPLWRILVFEGIALLMLVAAAVPGESATYTTVHRVTGIVLFGASSLYFGALLVAKLLRRTGRA
ncbi:MAG: hypothetical protein IT538_08930, partial [Variibacter sp.]|nr:hypothetical protein [Variibacter sp.]